MGNQRRARSAILAAATAVIVVGCGSGGDTVCVTNDVGEVCAERSDGGIAFSGRGLDPESDVTIDSQQVGPILYGVNADGELGSYGSGVLSFIADTEFIFTVWAVDADGRPLVGDIVIRS